MIGTSWRDASVRSGAIESKDLGASSNSLRTRLGGVIRDIRRKIEGDIALEDRFGSLLDLAHRVRHQTAASAWTQGLFAACARGGVHRQGKVRAPYAVLAAAGCNFSLLLRRLEELLRVLL